jgi:hypothetical protein
MSTGFANSPGGRWCGQKGRRRSAVAGIDDVLRSPERGNGETVGDRRHSSSIPLA